MTDIKARNGERLLSVEGPLSGANLRGAYLRGAYLRGADLRGADLRGANLERVNLHNCKLVGANIEEPESSLRPDFEG